MFPVPSHLPRSPTSPSSSLSTSSPDPVVDLIDPLFKAGPSSVSLKQVQAVREQLQSAIGSNKRRSHDLLIENFPTVSSHIQLGSSLRSEYAALETTLESLEREIDPSDTEASFLPPALDLLGRHFAAVHNKARAEVHVSALKALRECTTRIQRLEDAIWAGRGADEWVVKDLAGDEGHDLHPGTEVLKDTKTFKLASDRLQLFRSMVIEQVTDAFSQAVAFKTSPGGSDGVTITVQSKTTLQIPRIPQPNRDGSATTPSKPPPYSLPHIYNTLSAFSNLSSTLTSLKNRILRDAVPLLVDQSCARVEETASNTSSFRLQRSDGTRTPSDTLRDVAGFITFLHNTVLSECSHPEVRATWAELHREINQATLDKVLLPAMPSSLSSVESWLDLVLSAVNIEEAQSKDDDGVIKRFFAEFAGKAWADQRRKRVAEEVRKLVIGGWGGWEAKEAVREKELSMVVEVEVDDESVPEKEAQAEEKEEEDGFGWGFDDSPSASLDKQKSEPPVSETADQVEEDGWGFDETPQPGPSSPPRSPQNANAFVKGDGEGDGWDFDDTLSTPMAEAPKPVLVKPAREAKKLGKKVAKVKAVVEEDPWASGSESVSSLPSNSMSAVRPEAAAQTDDGWGWNEPQQQAVQTQPVGSAQKHPERKRKEMREEKRTIKETFLVSRACDKLVDIAERVLKESRDAETADLSSPSFARAPSILMASATDVFDLHRSLLPSHYSTQLHDVPTLSMQLYNDAFYLAERVEVLARSYPDWTAAEDLVARFRSLADYAFETQIGVQKDALMETINQAGGFILGSEVGLKNAEKAINGVVHNISTLSRVLKIVLPMTTYLAVMGYLLDEAVFRITSEITELRDITELESERINEVLKPLRTLEEVFVLEPGQPSTVVSHVPHWLKFCYISELLQANLIDIQYLFDTGALIDFSTEELVGLIRALFADSEKRDNVIERIERGVPERGVESGITQV